jgi:hypothetical protein
MSRPAFDVEKIDRLLQRLSRARHKETYCGT